MRLRGVAVGGLQGHEARQDAVAFEAVAEATEEAIVNSLFRARDMDGHRGAVQALPLERALPPAWVPSSMTVSDTSWPRGS